MSTAFAMATGEGGSADSGSPKRARVEMDTTPWEKEVVSEDKRLKSGEVFDSQLLRVYYDRLFPVSLMFSWLSYNDMDLIKRREFSFTLKDDIYIRYCSFATKEEFKAGLLNKVPFKIDIGAVFNASPKVHESVPLFKPLQKEFVIDIDITDYDDVRSCCSGADICLKCWPLMTAGIKVVDLALREDFGFEKLLWVYSGRRGVHCWVCDESARMMTNEARTAVIEYLSVTMAKSDEGNVAELSFPVHPALARAYRVIEETFWRDLVEGQGYFETDQSCLKMMKLFLPSDMKPEEKTIFDLREMEGDGWARWTKFKKELEKWNSRTKAAKYSAGRCATQSLVFTHVYPRLDINVSKQLNHLLKSPFCVHPKTGRVCVPIDPATCEKFNPFKVPTLHHLHQQLNQFSGMQNSKKSWMMTDLKPAIEHFERFVDDLIKTSKQSMMQEKIESGRGLEDDW